MKKVLKALIFARCNNSKKLKGNMVVTIIIFMLSFLVFCICAIDVGCVVVSRYKVQKVTETAALYMASYLNSKPVDERTKEALEPLKKRFEDLYSNSLSGYYNFVITNIELKDETTSPKIKISAEANIPTLFLKYVGIGVIKIMQVSYAKADTSDMMLKDSDANSYTFEADNIITDKRGDDIKVKYNGDYFIFAGIKGDEDEILWSDISFASNRIEKKFKIPVGEGEYELGCISKSSSFDFSKTDEKTIGLVKYVKIYKGDCSRVLPSDETIEEGTGDSAGTEIASDSTETVTEEPTESIEESGTTESAEEEDGGDTAVTTPEIQILNSVKLIRKSEF